MFWFWFFVAPALLLALLSLLGERKRADYVERRLGENPEWLPPATVIVPVKGPEEGLRENLAALAALDYPDYELIVVARAPADIPPGVLPPCARIVLAHGDISGQAPHASEKVQNLLAAVNAARKCSEVYAFADSDGRPTPRWLCALVAPLAEESVGASTGYRWFTPVPPTFCALLRGVWDAAAGGLLGPGANRFTWGGATAIRKQTFFAARVPERWKRAVSDDYALSRALRAAGLTVAYAPGALTPCFDHIGFRALLGWMRRQMLLTRIHAPRMWWEGLIAHLFYCGGMAASIVASIRGYRLAEWALIAQISPGMLKGLNRATLARAALPECDDWFRRHAWVHAIWVPLATWFWLAAFALSAFGNTIHWRGYSYNFSVREDFRG